MTTADAPDPRLIAVDVLVRVEAGAPSDRVLDRELRTRSPEERDRGLVTELVYGVLRRRRSLDRRLQPFCRRQLSDLDPAVRAGLRVGVYQLAYLDRIPEHAAVHTAVEAVKRRRAPAAGLVNAVLRAWIREGGSDGADAAAPPGSDPEDAESLCRRFDVPLWWGARWVERYGVEVASRWFAAALEPAPLSLRFHPRVASVDELVADLRSGGIDLRSSASVPGAWRVESAAILGTEAFRRGAMTARSEGSQLSAACLGVEPGQRVLDACCGRGGKAVQVAEDGDPGLVLGLDRSHRRLLACRRGAARSGTPEVVPVAADLEVGIPSRLAFERVLVDAPCSGLGTVRRRPEIKWRIRESDLAARAAVQRRILTTALGSLAPGGRLLYVTCSTEPEENEQVVEEVLQEAAGIGRRRVDLPPSVAPELVGEDGYLRTYPEHPDLDGFFAASLERVGGTGTGRGS